VISALSPVSLLSSSADLKGAAFQQVLSSATRAGMGQYFTPEPVVDCVVEILDPQPWERAVDPFCGSGRFLTVALQHMRTKASRGDCELHGIEKSDRMIRIALTDVLLRGLKSVYFHKGDALSVESLPGGLEPESFDVLLTNPPFGSILNNTEYLAEHFELARGREVVPLEVLGLELSLHLLKPGGRMAIVLPESVLNTRQMQDVRRFMTTQSEVTAVVSLPPQTFAPFDGVGKASVLFLRKGKAARSSTGVFFAAPRHVGYDNTGRVDALNDLPGVAAEFKRFCKEDYVADPEIAIIDDASRALENMSFAAARNRRSEKCGPTRPLGDLCVDLFCGRTPARSSYTNAGIRILKVRDLTGEGLDWTPGERSFVAPEFLGRGRKTCLQTGDIVLTAAAHHPKYIGQKVDIVDAIPDHYARDGVTCVAELLLIRVDPKLCDPYVLLLWLRSREGYESLQGCVVGQTAHLYATEVRNIRLPEAVFCPSQAVTQAVNLLKEALRLRAAFKMKHERATEVFSAAW
jgi:type I restriction enzyme M protein